MQDLYVEGSILWERFQNPSQYLQARRQIEQWLYQEFIARGGAPQQPYPIYMDLDGPSGYLRRLMQLRWLRPQKYKFRFHYLGNLM